MAVQTIAYSSYYWPSNTLNEHAEETYERANEKSMTEPAGARSILAEVRSVRFCQAL
jgi:hypothetical protein